MELFSKMMGLQLKLLVLMMLGYFIKKWKIIDNNQQKGLSNLLIKVIIPANIINSFISGIQMNQKLMDNIIAIIIISILVQIVALVASPLVFRRFDKTKRNVMTYGMIVSNSSFIGIPVVNYIYGDLATLYTSIFQIPMRIMMWTSGLSLFTTNFNKKEKFKLMITHPCIVSVFVGFILMVLQITLPDILTSTVKSLSGCLTPMSMLVIGAILADIDLKGIFDFSTIYYTLFRLIIFPVVTIVILNVFKVDSLVKAVAVILNAMPCGSTTAIIAQQYGYDYQYAAKIIFVSTILSVLTIPVICLLL